MLAGKQISIAIAVLSATASLAATAGAAVRDAQSAKRDGQPFRGGGQSEQVPIFPEDTKAPGPQPPRDVYAEAIRADEVLLTWLPGGEPAAGEHYVVLRDGEVVADTENLRFVDRWREERHRYTYVVRAMDEQGRAAEAPPATVDTPRSEVELTAGPYLQQLTTRRVVVIWHTFEPATTSLQVGPPGGPQVTLRRNAKLTTRHTVAVSGLAPDAAYRYRWESEGRLGPPKSFRTAPAGLRQFSFGVIGDYGINTPAAGANLRRLSEDQIDFAITTGDNAQLTGAEFEYLDYVFRPLRSFLAAHALWPSIGNHDYRGLYNYLRYFAVPNGGRYYSFTYGGVLFVALYSNRFDLRQRIWLSERLRASNARCKVAYFHHPLWSSGPGYWNPVRPRRRRHLVPLLQRGGVDLALSGHVQNYERSRPLRGGKRNRRGIVYVVTGGGGAPLNPFVTRRKPRWSARRGLFHHRLRMTATGKELIGKAIDTQGNTRDRFRVPCR